MRSLLACKSLYFGVDLEKEKGLRLVGVKQGLPHLLNRLRSALLRALNCSTVSPGGMSANDVDFGAISLAFEWAMDSILFGLDNLGQRGGNGGEGDREGPEGQWPIGMD